MRSSSASSLHPATHLGRVTLRVADLEPIIGFYSGGAGLELIARESDRAVLGHDGTTSVELVLRRDLARAQRGAAGLYHTAVLYRDRADLAAAIYTAGTATAGRFTGSADHLVSEAFYFDDPEGNGVELYWDRPRDQWRFSDGTVAMDTLPLDPNAFIERHHAGNGAPTAPVGAATSLGHVHLKVGDIAAAHGFYVDALGFEVTAAMGASALFTSAGGYHHHVGMNVWESRGAGRRTEALGLDRFSVVVSDRVALEATAERLTAAHVQVQRLEDTTGVRLEAADPWGTVVEVVVGG